MSVAEMFGNRVRKNARHLGKWARRENVTCWRVYDRDIPEVPVAVDRYSASPFGDAARLGGAEAFDRYSDALVIHDYRHEPDDDVWSAEIVATATSVLDAKEAFVKRRERLVARREGHQYERVAEAGAWRTVREGGHAFRVNLSDYVDTGLFLDHRITRARAAAESARTMLNLFAYTGAFSVYCAAAGMQTTSVDLSKTYLDWASENLALNRLRGEIVHADVREFLADARRTGQRWDLVVVDPPTFSNSKRMDYTLDIQRDHVALLDDVFDLCDGVVWFSTNRRSFKLAWTHPHAAITDETYATTPPDFRDARHHHAFRICRSKR